MHHRKYEMSSKKMSSKRMSSNHGRNVVTVIFYEFWWLCIKAMLKNTELSNMNFLRLIRKHTFPKQTQTQLERIKDGLK